MDNPLLSLKNIGLKIKGQTILENLSMEVFAGDFIVILGSNGSGKSSLIKIINGLMQPTDGDVCLDGRSILATSTFRRSQEIVTLTQDLSLSTFSTLTVVENCLIAMQRNQKTSFAIPTRKDRDRVASHLELYHAKLCEKLDEPLSSLSGGERQILAFAMSLWSLPKLLLLDEHTSALDPSMAQKLMSMTSQTVDLKKITTIAVTHRLEDALQYGNRLIALHQGRIVLNVQDKTHLTREDLVKIYRYK